MNFKAVITVFQKELRDSLRDKRTLFAMFLFPMLLFPLITLVTSTVMSKVMNKARSETAQVLLLGGEDSPRVVTMLKTNPKLQVQVAPADWKQRISDKQARLAIEIPKGFDVSLASETPSELKLYHYEGEMRSSFALNEVRRMLTEYRDQVLRERLVTRGLQIGLLKPFEIQAKNVAPPEKVGGNMIGGMIPYLFILFCFTGAIYPAIDLTAGEKERGTMETILCSPIARIDLVLGKFLMVLTAALATVVSSLLSMALSVLIGGGIFGSSLASSGKAAAGAASGGMPFLFEPMGFVGIIILVIPLAACFAALLLAIALSAKSTKEAQSLVTPLIAVIIVPAMIGLLPGVELNLKLSLVPILGLALASKEMLSGVWHWGYLALIFGSCCLYAAAALAFCVRQFNRESVLFRS